MLRPTTAHNFSSLILPHGSAPAALASYFSTLVSHKSLENTVFRDFSTFSRACIFFLFLFSSLTHPTSAAFSSVHLVGSLTSRLPSNMFLSCTCLFLTTLLLIDRANMKRPKAFGQSYACAAKSRRQMFCCIENVTIYFEANRNSRHKTHDLLEK